MLSLAHVALVLTPAVVIGWAFASFLSLLLVYVLVSISAYLFYDIVKGEKREELVRFRPWLVAVLLVVTVGGLGDLLHVSLNLKAPGMSVVVNPSAGRSSGGNQ